MEVSDVDEELTKSEDAIKALSPSSETRRITFKYIDRDGTQKEIDYIQAQMGMYHTQEFITMMTRVIKDVLEGKYEVDVIALFRDREKLKAVAVPENIDDSTIEEVLREWKPVVEGFLKLMNIVPSLQKDIIALSLGVREEERESFKYMISQAPYLGGLATDDAFDILDTFIRQNAKAIRRFLGKQVPKVFSTLMETLEEDREIISTTGGTPSSTSAQPTPESA